MCTIKGKETKVLGEQYVLQIIDIPSVEYNIYDALLLTYM